METCGNYKYHAIIAAAVFDLDDAEPTQVNVVSGYYLPHLRACCIKVTLITREHNIIVSIKK